MYRFHSLPWLSLFSLSLSLPFIKVSRAVLDLLKQLAPIQEALLLMEVTSRTIGEACSIATELLERLPRGTPICAFAKTRLQVATTGLFAAAHALDPRFAPLTGTQVSNSN